jgi:hypothetical protein
MNPSLYNPMTSPINTSGFGGAGQMPSFANNPFGPPQQNTGGGFGGFGGQQPNAGSQFNAAQNPGAAANQFKVPDWVQEPEPGMVTGQAFTEITNPATGEKFMAPNTGYSVREQQQPAPVGSGFGHPQPISDMQDRREQFIQRQQPFGGQFGQQVPQSALQSPEFQGYQTQMRGLQQQMDEYVRKAPMYQQLEDLNNKMQAYQQRHIGQFQQPQASMMGLYVQPQQQQAMQQAMQRQMMERQSPFRQNPYQRQLGGGIQGLMGILGGRGGRGGMRPPPYMPTMGMPRDQYAMTMDMPQYQGRSFDLPTNFMKNGGKV